MKKKILKLLLSMFGIITLMVALVCLLVLFFGSYYWQVGYTSLEWVNAGIEQLEEDNKLPNYDEYEIFFVDITREEDYIWFSYNVEFYETQERDYSKDIDLWYVKVTTYTFNICLERSKCFYNKLQYFAKNKEGLVEDCKFEKCLDFDILVEVE